MASEKTWEPRITRQQEQRRSSDGKRRTVGMYQVFHNDVPQTGAYLKGMVAETRGPGANHPVGNGKRIEPGRYRLATQNGVKYVTFNYKESESRSAKPKPGIELLDTGDRKEILVHPGQGFLASTGCINPCTSLPDRQELITYATSRRRVIALIEDMKSYLGDDFPTRNGRQIPNAFVVIEGEPSLD